ncbi:lysosomal proton-coupled steroid conjugate and bile acid symporter SLC46A3 [Eucyclogobius newberryi]|uniref:lysosomal proton-coupled steroid conjugate and bile acid symporter SLC46A3 n=1 Tax=Eucyclogobius newberryi TaxID=166745 RepID=UPI003B5B8516
MKGVYLVEPAVGLYAFSCFLIFPLMQQFIYRRLWEDLTNTTYPEFDNVSRCAKNSSNNGSSYHEEVQKQASLLSLYSELFSAIPSFIVTILLVAYSDRGGRKIAIVMPVIGTLLYITGVLSISYFQLNIYLIIGCSVVSSLFGGFGTFLGGCFAYVADISENDHQKTLRLAGVDMILGVLAGVASLSTGYFLKAAGFNWPFVTSLGGLILLLLYVFFALEETVQKVPRDASVLDSSSQDLAIKQMCYGIYHVFAGADAKFKTILVLLLVAFITFTFTNFGGSSLITLYELNEPLCWTEITIGYGSALGTTVLLTSFLGVMAFSYCKVTQTIIVLVGFLSFMSGMIMVSFAKTTTMMFIARIPMCLCAMPFPILRSMMSKFVSKAEQGALFACISCSESLTSTVSMAIFNSIYAATVAWDSGFVFVLSAGLCIIPSILIGVLIVMRVDFSTKDKQVLISEQGLIQDHNDDAGVIN